MTTSGIPYLKNKFLRTLLTPCVVAACIFSTSMNYCSNHIPPVVCAPSVHTDLLQFWPMVALVSRAVTKTLSQALPDVPNKYHTCQFIPLNLHSFAANKGYHMLFVYSLLFLYVKHVPLTSFLYVTQLV